ncbi:NitT/TauT family transport system permease protein [Rhodococcus sp. 27YEA15]|uniref:ABC transporter permease n=1 Tax=Rhodococcus sp. 27YEA15 TaxID=3156259 RepID=UPI003C7BCF20
MTSAERDLTEVRERVQEATRRRGRGSWLWKLSPLSPILLLLVWEGASRSGMIDARFFPPPTTIIGTFGDMISSGDLWDDSAATLTRVFVGFLIGAVPAVLLGIALGSVRVLRAVFGPIITSLLPVPKVAIFPLLILIFGLGEMSKYAIVAIGVFFYIFFNTMSGVLQTPPVYLDVATANGASALQRWLTVALPSALPNIFTGLRLSIAGAFVIIAAAEFVGAEKGLGFLVWSSWSTFAVSKMYVGIITISLYGYLAALLVGFLERRLVPWSKQ